MRAKLTSHYDEKGRETTYFIDGKEVPWDEWEAVAEKDQLRDKFAMHALGGITSAMPDWLGPRIVAEWSYVYADAMLKTRDL